MATVKMSFQGDVRVTPCPRCGESVKISNMGPANAPRGSVACPNRKCGTVIEWTRSR